MADSKKYLSIFKPYEDTYYIRDDEAQEKLAEHETRIKACEDKNDEQDEEIEQIESELVVIEKYGDRITECEEKNTEQDAAIEENEAAIASLSNSFAQGQQKQDVKIARLEQAAFDPSQYQVTPFNENLVAPFENLTPGNMTYVKKYTKPDCYLPLNVEMSNMGDTSAMRTTYANNYSTNSYNGLFVPVQTWGTWVYFNLNEWTSPIRTNVDTSKPFTVQLLYFHNDQTVMSSATLNFENGNAPTVSFSLDNSTVLVTSLRVYAEKIGIKFAQGTDYAVGFRLFGVKVEQGSTATAFDSISPFPYYIKQALSTVGGSDFTVADLPLNADNPTITVDQLKEKMDLGTQTAPTTMDFTVSLVKINNTTKTEEETTYTDVDAHIKYSVVNGLCSGVIWVNAANTFSIDATDTEYTYNLKLTSANIASFPVPLVSTPWDSNQFVLSGSMAMRYPGACENFRITQVEGVTTDISAILQGFIPAKVYDGVFLNSSFAYPTST